MATHEKTLVPVTPQSSAVYHGTDGEKHFVGLGPMRVIICFDSGFWFAQGLEVDYAAQASTLEDVKKNFEDGLTATVDLHIKAYGNLKKFAKAAPQDVWDELYTKGIPHTYAKFSVHDDLTKTLGYEGINYYEREALAA